MQTTLRLPAILYFTCTNTLGNFFTSELSFLESQQRQARAQRKGGLHLKSEALSLPGTQVQISCFTGPWVDSVSVQRSQGE